MDTRQNDGGAWTGRIRTWRWRRRRARAARGASHPRGEELSWQQGGGGGSRAARCHHVELLRLSECSSYDGLSSQASPPSRSLSPRRRRRLPRRPTSLGARLAGSSTPSSMAGLSHQRRRRRHGGRSPRAPRRPPTRAQVVQELEQQEASWASLLSWWGHGLTLARRRGRRRRRHGRDAPPSQTRRRRGDAPRPSVVKLASLVLVSAWTCHHRRCAATV